MDTPASQPSDRQALKLAQQIAMRIEEDIMGSGWKVGELIGSEAELAARYGVSRWVIREAIRITEQDGLVEIRRGRSGGIVVSAPVLNVVGSTIRRFLSISRVSHDELFEARLVLERFAAALACQRLDADRIQSLRAMLERAKAAGPEDHLLLTLLLLREVLNAADNAALKVFTYSLSQVTTYLALLRGLSEEELKEASGPLITFRIALVEAILDGDMAAAEAQVEAFLKLSIRSQLRPVRALHSDALEASRRLLGLGPGKPASRPRLTEQIAWRMEYDLAANDWPPGKMLGSETELMARYEVSRSVIREAIRPLERLGVVEMCRGKNSGLKVTRPDPAAIVRSVVLFLNYSKNSDFVSFELRREIERVVVSDLLGARDDLRQAVSAELLRFSRHVFPPSLDGERRAVHDLGLLLSQATDNRIFSFFLRILSESVLVSVTSSCTLSAEEAGAAIAAVQAEAARLAAILDAGGEAARARDCVDRVWEALRRSYEQPRRSGGGATPPTDNNTTAPRRSSQGGSSMKSLAPDTRIALLINECQRGLLDPDHAVFPQICEQAAARGIVPRIARLAEAFRKAGQPVVYINMGHRPDFAGVALTHPAVAHVVKMGGLREGYPDTEVVPDLAPRESDHVVRRYTGMTAFYGNHLDQLLRVLKVDTVVPAGVSTDVAVPGMVFGALDRGLKVILAEDCVAGTCQEVHDVMVGRIFQPLARITTAEALAAALPAPVEAG